MDKTPSLTRALIGLTLLIAAIVGGYLALRAGSDSERRKEARERGTAIRFVRSGGWGGTATLVIDDEGSGRITEENGAGKTANPVDLKARDETRIVTAFSETSWPEKSKFYSTGGCADCYLYNITYGGVRVSFSLRTPKRFTKVVRVVNSVLKSEL